MFSSVLRVFILYFFVLIVVRVMGKRQIGEMQPFELVITLIIADLATIPMAEHTLPLFYGIVPVVTLLLIQCLFSFLSKKSLFFRKTLNGKSVVVVNTDGINFNELKKLNMNLNDLMEAVRIAGYVSLSEVAFVIVETNGKTSVIPRAANAPAAPDDLGIIKQEITLPSVVVADGKIMETNCNFLKVSKEKIEKFVEKLCGKGCKVKDVCIFTLDKNGKAYIQKYGESSLDGEVNFKGQEQ